MIFLNSMLFWFLVPLIALPLVIHLLNKRFPRLFPFPSVENIRQTLARRSRLQKWRHLILLLLRTAFLLLLLLAFLKPIRDRFGGDPHRKGERYVLVLLDRSLSMEFKSGGPSSRERAVDEAEKLIDSLEAKDWVNVILLEQSPTSCFVDFSKNHAEAIRFVKAQKAGLLKADVNQANALAARMLAKSRGKIDLYYISDFQRKNWANADFSAIPETARFFFVNVAPKVTANRAVIEAHINQASILAGETVPLEISLGNYSEQPFQDRISIQIDKKLSFDQELFVAPWSVAKTTVPIPAPGPGLHQVEIVLPTDGLPQDDRYLLTLPVLEKEEVLIVSDEPESKTSSAYFLKTALNPFENLKGSLLPKVITSKELTLSRLAGVKKMFFVKMGALDEAAAQAVAKYVFQGGGLIYFLDGEQDAGNLQRLEKFTVEGAVPLRLTQRKTAKNVGTGGQQIVRGDFKSRYLKLFRGVTRQDLGLLEFYDYYQASALGSSGILLSYGDESPAMAAGTHGLGTLLFLNFSAGELSSNLARQRIFPVWVQELVKSISIEEPLPSSHVVGETIQTEIWKSDARQAFLTPTGQAFNPKKEAEGERFRVSFVSNQLGFYTQGSSPALAAFAVNASPDESDLRPVDPDLLPAQTKDHQGSHFVSGRAEFEEALQGRPLFHYFIYAALIFLCLETGFQWMLRRVAV